MDSTFLKLLIRHSLTLVGGALAARGVTIPDSQAELIAGGLATAIAVAWSAWEKKTKETPNAPPTPPATPTTQ